MGSWLRLLKALQYIFRLITLHIFQFKETHDNKQITIAPDCSRKMKLFNFQDSLRKESLKYYSFSTDFLRLLRSCQIVSCPLIRPKHQGAAGKFDYAYISKIFNGLSLAAPHSETRQLY